jgi:KDO2-lipid IV(A) lauroyltransferase
MLGIELLQALRRGEVVALQGDRPRAGQDSRMVPLFGRPVALPHGPAALARAAGVPLLPVFVYHVRRRHYRVVLRPLIEVGNGPDRDADLAAAMARIALELEGAIRRAPEQWFCFAPAFAATARGTG